MVAEMMPVSRSELVELGLPCPVTRLEDVIKDNEVVDIKPGVGVSEPI